MIICLKADSHKFWGPSVPSSLTADQCGANNNHDTNNNNNNNNDTATTTNNNDNNNDKHDNHNNTDNDIDNDRRQNCRPRLRAGRHPVPRGGLSDRDTWGQH